MNIKQIKIAEAASFIVGCVVTIVTGSPWYILGAIVLIGVGEMYAARTPR